MLKHPSWCSAVHQYLPLCWRWMASEVSEEECSYASRFCCWFFKTVLKSCLLLFVVLLSWTGTLCTVSSLKLDCLWRGTKVLDTEVFPWYNIADLNSDIKFIVLLSHWEALTVEGNEHTHRHTYTQPCPGDLDDLVSRNLIDTWWVSLTPW